MRYTVIIALLLTVLSLSVPTGTRASQTSPPDEIVSLAVDAVGSIDTATLESRHRSDIETALDELQSLFATELSKPLTISFGAPPETRIRNTWQMVDDLAWIDPAHGQAIVAIDPFLQLSPIEAGNVLRNLIARSVLREASHGALPAGLNAGLASYVERPVLAEQARRGSLVQQVDLSQTMPDLASIVNASPASLEGETRTAVQYAFAAFIADHYGVASVQSLVFQTAGSTNWQVPLTAATGQSIEQIDVAWDQFLPRWFSGGWQSNAVGGFDMSQAQTLFDRGAYSSAISAAEQSQQLFTDLNDLTRLSEVEAFISLSAIGVRAEQLMKDVQTSLEQRDYAQAQAKLDEAELQYTYLPDSHRPASLMTTYRLMIDQGIAATGDLAKATLLSSNWSTTHDARNLATSAGNAFAALGDQNNAQTAEQMVSQLNLRLQRITLAAIALIVLVAIWLLVWLWARAPHRFVWTDPRHVSRRVGRAL